MPMSPGLNQPIRDPITGRMYPDYASYMRAMYAKGSTGGGGGSFPSYQQLYAESLNRATSQAREANERRYQEILQGYEGLGEQEAADIKQEFMGRESQDLADLTSRGLSGTTIRSDIRRGYAGAMSDAVSRSRERWTLEKLGFMERRTDEYPDIGMYLQMMQQYGRYGGGTTQIPRRVPSRQHLIGPRR